MKKIAALLTIIFFTIDASLAESILTYKIGSVKVSETSEELKLSIPKSQPIRIKVLPGGALWPPLFIDESG